MPTVEHFHYQKLSTLVNIGASLLHKKENITSEKKTLFDIVNFCYFFNNQWKPHILSKCWEPRQIAPHVTPTYRALRPPPKALCQTFPLSHTTTKKLPNFPHTQHFAYQSDHQSPHFLAYQQSRKYSLLNICDKTSLLSYPTLKQVILFSKSASVKLYPMAIFNRKSNKFFIGRLKIVLQKYYLYNFYTSYFCIVILKDFGSAMVFHPWPI